MEIAFKGILYTVVVDGNDIILQSVKQNVNFYGAYSELLKQAEREFERFYSNERRQGVPMLTASEEFISEFVDHRIESYLNSIAIMGEVTVHQNN